jgi:hypothetical protein
LHSPGLQAQLDILNQTLHKNKRQCHSRGAASTGRGRVVVRNRDFSDLRREIRQRNLCNKVVRTVNILGGLILMLGCQKSLELVLNYEQREEGPLYIQCVWPC